MTLLEGKHLWKLVSSTKYLCAYVVHISTQITLFCTTYAFHVCSQSSLFPDTCKQTTSHRIHRVGIVLAWLKGVCNRSNLLPLKIMMCQSLVIFGDWDSISFFRTHDRRGCTQISATYKGKHRVWVHTRILPVAV